MEADFSNMTFQLWNFSEALVSLGEISFQVLAPAVGRDRSCFEVVGAVVDVLLILDFGVISVACSCMIYSTKMHF